MKSIVEYINEDRKPVHYELTYFQYDPDTLAEYENGDVSDDELHDSAIPVDFVGPEEFIVGDEKTAIKHAENEVKKWIKKYPEICGGELWNTDANKFVKTISI